VKEELVMERMERERGLLTTLARKGERGNGENFTEGKDLITGEFG